MRHRLAEAKRPKNRWDLKTRAGGLQDIEFIAQTLQIADTHALPATRTATAAALTALGSKGVLARDEARFLIETFNLYMTVMQIIRLTHGSEFDPGQASAACRASLGRTAGGDDLGALEVELSSRSERVRAIYNAVLQDNLPWSDG